MSLATLVITAITVLLFVYLAAALLFPEKF